MASAPNWKSIIDGMSGWITSNATKFYGTAKQSQDIKAALAEQGITLPFKAYAYARDLYSTAVANNEGARLLYRAGNQDAISEDMVNNPFYARDLQDRNTTPFYSATVEFVTEENGVQTIDHRPVPIGGALPTTKGDLLDAIEEWNNDPRNKSPISYTSIGTIYLNSV